LHDHETIATPAAYDALRGMFDDLHLRRSDGFSIYVRVPPEHREAIARGATQVLAGHEYDILEPSVAPSVMDGPELAVMAATATAHRYHPRARAVG
jgi:hypothetical protein